MRSYSMHVIGATAVVLILLSCVASFGRAQDLDATLLPRAYGIYTRQITAGGGIDSLPVYGTKGVESSTSNPGTRRNPCTWIHVNEATGEKTLWLYSGSIHPQFPPDFATPWDAYQDIWKLNLTTEFWTWVNGSQSATPTTPLPGYPGTRMKAQTWVVGDRLYLQGGFTGDYQFATDLWYYDVTTDAWTQVDAGGTTEPNCTTHTVGGRYGAAMFYAELTPAEAGGKYGATEVYMYGGGREDSVTGVDIQTGYQNMWKWNATAQYWHCLQDYANTGLQVNTPLRDFDYADPLLTYPGFVSVTQRQSYTIATAAYNRTLLLYFVFAVNGALPMGVLGFDTVKIRWAPVFLDPGTQTSYAMYAGDTPFPYSSASCFGTRVSEEPIIVCLQTARARLADRQSGPGTSHQPYTWAYSYTNNSFFDMGSFTISEIARTYSVFISTTSTLGDSANSSGAVYYGLGFADAYRLSDFNVIRGFTPQWPSAQPWDLTTEIAWVGGFNGSDTTGVYGELGANGTSITRPPGRLYAASWTYVPDGGTGPTALYIYGGLQSTGHGYFVDMWRFDTESSTWSWIGGAQNLTTAPCCKVTNSTTSAWPGTLVATHTWRVGKKLYLYGGVSDAEGPGSIFSASGSNELWEYDIDTNAWTYLYATASTTPNCNTNNPGARAGGNVFAIPYVDTDVNWVRYHVYMYGGQSTALNAANNMWRWDPVSKNFTCIQDYPVGGSSNIGTPYRDFSSSVPADVTYPYVLNQPGWVHSSDLFIVATADGFLFGYNVTANRWAPVSNLTYASGPVYPIATGNSSSTIGPGMLRSYFAWTDYAAATVFPESQLMLVCDGTNAIATYPEGQSNMWSYAYTTDAWTYHGGIGNVSYAPAYRSDAGPMGPSRHLGTRTAGVTFSGEQEYVFAGFQRIPATYIGMGSVEFYTGTTPSSYPATAYNDIWRVSVSGYVLPPAAPAPLASPVNPPPVSPPGINAPALIVGASILGTAVVVVLIVVGVLIAMAPGTGGATAAGAAGTSVAMAASASSPMRYHNLSSTTVVRRNHSPAAFSSTATW